MDKANAFYYYRNEMLGVHNLTSHQREDMAWTIKHFGLDECKKAYYAELNNHKNETEMCLKFDQDELDYLQLVAEGII